MNRVLSLLVSFIAVNWTALAFAGPPSEARASYRADTAFSVTTLATGDWQNGPPSLPPGAQFIKLEGDPAKSGPFTLRVKMPAGYRVPPHTHPADERVTVLSGTLKLGHGDSIESSQTEALSAGSFALIPKGHHHFAIADEESVVQLHGEGPWQIKYLNRADDPRMKAAK